MLSYDIKLLHVINLSLLRLLVAQGMLIFTNVEILSHVIKISVYLSEYSQSSHKLQHMRCAFSASNFISV